MTRIIAIVPAAGTGSRMRQPCPKQYLTINGKTLLEHAVDRLLASPRVTQVIIALHPQDRHFARLPLAADPRVRTVTGGGVRAESVLSALQAVEHYDWALVHDAARPCLHPADLHNLLALTATCEHGGILACPVRDTMKRTRPDLRICQTVDRERLWHALTPQLFPLALLRQCLSQALAAGATITDEASALEYCGLYPQIVCGRADNIKITQPEDLALAQFYLSRLPAPLAE